MEVYGQTGPAMTFDYDSPKEKEEQNPAKPIPAPYDSSLAYSERLSTAG